MFDIRVKLKIQKFRECLFIHLYHISHVLGQNDQTFKIMPRWLTIRSREIFWRRGRRIGKVETSTRVRWKDWSQSEYCNTLQIAMQCLSFRPISLNNYRIKNRCKNLTHGHGSYALSICKCFKLSCLCRHIRWSKVIHFSFVQFEYARLVYYLHLKWNFNWVYYSFPCQRGFKASYVAYILYTFIKTAW